MSGDVAAPQMPPHDVQAEMGALGSMLLSRDAVFLARERLTADCFYKLAHQDIFEAILAVCDERNTVDLILLRDELKKRDKLDSVGGIAYLAELMEAVPTSANAEYYSEIVREHGIRRKLIDTATEIQKRSYRNGQDVGDLLDYAERTMLAVRHLKEAGKSANMNDILQALVDRLDKLHQNPGQLTGLSTGFYDLNRITCGLQPGEFIVVAARPSVGKTSLALNILHHVCGVERRPAVFFTLETSAEQIVSNLLCIHNEIDTQQFRTGALDEQQWSDIESSIDELVGMPLYVDDSAALGVLDLRARARRMVHRHHVELVVVDYLQLLQPSKRYENRANAVADISKGLKALARELGIPVLAVAQLNRSVETEQRRPRMSDLRESGAIEQDADVILLLHRATRSEEEEDYVATSTTTAPPASTMSQGSPADVIVAKQRNGPTGVCPLAFWKRYLKFKPRSSLEDQ